MAQVIVLYVAANSAHQAVVKAWRWVCRAVASATRSAIVGRRRWDIKRPGRLVLSRCSADTDGLESPTTGRRSDGCNGARDFEVAGYVDRDIREVQEGTTAAGA